MANPLLVTVSPEVLGDQLSSTVRTKTLHCMLLILPFHFRQPVSEFLLRLAFSPDVIGPNIVRGVVGEGEEIFGVVLGLHIHGSHKVHVDKVERFERFALGDGLSESYPGELSHGANWAAREVALLAGDCEVFHHSGFAEVRRVLVRHVT